MAQILEPEEIRKITGKKRWSAQIRALVDMGVDVICRPDGSPVVNAEHFNERTGVSQPLDSHSTVTLDLSA